VGFSVLQMLAFLYALAGKKFRQQVERHYRWVQAGLLVGSLVYVIGVVACYSMDLCLRGPSIDATVKQVLRYTLYGRICTIVVYAPLGIETLIAGRRWNEKERQAQLRARINSALYWPW